MPATEAVLDADLLNEELNSYELAFHILPTVAEEEVPQVFEELKSFITKSEGDIFDSEMAERIELAYTVYAHQEGKNRPYNSAYFGWLRFRVSPMSIIDIKADVESSNKVLRYLLIKLSKVEEAHPFKYHEAQKSMKKSVIVDEDDLSIDGESEKEGDIEEVIAEKNEEVSVEVDDDELDKALEKPEV